MLHTQYSGEMPLDIVKPGNCGRLLRALRLRAGLSQELLAQQAMLSPRTIRQIESGRSQPRPSTLKLLANALDLSEADWTSLLETTLPDSQTTTTAVSEAAVPDVPRQLTAAPHRFTGRAGELTELDAAVKTDPLWIITGPGGIGKTWLALRWAHDNADEFPDGQLYLNLRGFDADTAPVPTGEALRQLLFGLNVDPSVMPRDTAGRATLYRSLVAGRRLLVVLDNARDEAQVVDLLPGTASCVTLITSRENLMGLADTCGARHVRLTFFDEAESLSALTSHLGPQRVQAESESEAADALVEHCGGMPLALGILAARAAAHPQFPLSALAAELRDDSDRLDVLNSGGVHANLRTVFAGSLRQLPDTAVHTFHLLGLIPNSGFAAQPVASLMGTKLAETRACLRELEAASLVEQYLPGRYRMHDLTHLYAAELSRRELTATARIGAERRLVDHYLFTADSADQLLMSTRERHHMGFPTPGCLLTPITDRAVAAWWFDSELTNVLAAQRTAHHRGWHDKVWELAWLLKPAALWFGWYEEDIDVWSLACEAAQHLPKARSRTQGHLYLGQALLYINRFDEARDHLRKASDSAESDDDTPNLIGAHYVLAQSCEQQGDVESALAHALDAYRICCRRGGNAAEQGQTLALVGWIRSHTGDVDQARSDCEHAADLLREIDFTEPLADTLGYLGRIAVRQRRFDDALEHFTEARDLYRAASGGRRSEDADISDRLGDVHLAKGELAEAHADWGHALERFRSLNRTAESEAVQAKMASHVRPAPLMSLAA